MPSVPGSDALSSLVKQVSSLPSNPPNPEGDLNPGSERRPEFAPPSYMDTDSQGSLPPDINNLNPVVNESLSIKIWWPKDRVVFHRVQQLCQLVVSGEWPAKPEKPERLIDQPVLASEMSMSPSGFPVYAESEMDAALGPEAIVDPAVSKAFKIKKVFAVFAIISTRHSRVYLNVFEYIFVARRVESHFEEKQKEKEER